MLNVSTELFCRVQLRRIARKSYHMHRVINLNLDLIGQRLILMFGFRPVAGFWTFEDQLRSAEPHSAVQ
jgi:hypothetical protein